MRAVRSIRLVAAASLLAAGLMAVAATPAPAQTGWYRVQFDDRITSADRDAIEAAGADAVQYAPDDAYVAWLDGTGVAAVAALDGVADVRTLTPREKVDPAVRTAGGQTVVTAVVHRDAAQAAVLDLAAFADIGDVRAASSAGARTDLLLRLDADDVDRVAARPDVLHVSTAPVRLLPEDEASVQIQAGNYVGNNPSLGYEGWLGDIGLTGEGVRVAIVDTGVSSEHPDLGDRVVAQVDRTRLASRGGEPIDSGGHGTHVAGIVGGDATGLSAATLDRSTDDDGFLYGLGVAPEVEFIDINAISTIRSTGWPPADGWEPITRAAIDLGANVWNASWWTGECTGCGYVETARLLDEVARDGHWDADGNQEFTLVFSAGNSGTGTAPNENRLTSPKEAKNIIVVAASNNVRAGNIQAIASFSSRGPANDGRVVPTVAAPGASIISTRPTAGQSCGTPLTEADGLLYSSCSGTSMAAPHVTGAVALITQWWRGLHDGATPSPALNKALLVNTAVDLGAADIPNRHEGWGRVHLGNLFDASAQRVYVDQDTVLSEVDEEITYTVQVADATQPVKVTLAWTDAPGEAGADVPLVNDLDLVVDAGGARYLGNAFADGWSVADDGTGAANRVDNLENVYLRAGADGTVTITIRAHRLPGDAIPGNGDLTDQDFALVVSNGSLVTNG